MDQAVSRNWKVLVLIVLVVAVGAVAILFVGKGAKKAPGAVTSGQKVQESPGIKLSTVKLISSVFENNQLIPQKYTCDGEDVSPPLKISDVPDAARSLVLIVDDPDAPSGDWVHWTVWNIDPKTTEVAENSVPDDGIEGLTDFGKSGWGGPCPPSGTHHYQFKLYALDSTLNLSSSSKKVDIEEAMEGHILDQTLLVGLFKRD